LRYLKNNRGFTLVEVIASIVIIAILLLSFFQVFIQNNKTAVYNNERLVVINLAHAELERLKIDPFGASADGKIKKPTSTIYSDSATKTSKINNRDYTIKIDAKQSSDEKDLNLINVTVTAISSNGKTKNSVEGYVEYE